MDCFGDEIIFEKAHESFVRSLSKRLVSKVIWRRYKPILRTVGVLDRNSLYGVPHSHIAIEMPYRIAAEADCGEALIREAANANKWIDKGRYSIDIRSFEAQYHMRYLATKMEYYQNMGARMSITDMKGKLIITGPKF